MRMYFKQRMFSWFDSYGNEVGTVKEAILTFLPKFEVYLHSQYQRKYFV